MYSHLFKQTAILKVIDGADSYGAPIISEVRTIRCRIDFTAGIVVGAAGNEVSSSGKLFTEADVKVGDVVTVQNVDYTVLQACYAVDFDGNYAVTEVYF